MREILVFLGLPMWAMWGPKVIFIASRFCGEAALQVVLSCLGKVLELGAERAWLVYRKV